MTEPLKLSIICPIYNKKVFLEESLQSIAEACAQELCEIILVDDGSTDGSGLIADLFQQNNLNVHVFHTENHGVSAARNYGLNVAKGELVTFVDADDRVINDSFTQVLSCIDQNTDIYICGAVFGDGDINKCDLREDVVLQVEERPVFDNFLTGGVLDESYKAVRVNTCGVAKRNFIEEIFCLNTIFSLMTHFQEMRTCSIHWTAIIPLKRLDFCHLMFM